MAWWFKKTKTVMLFFHDGSCVERAVIERHGKHYARFDVFDVFWQQLNDDGTTSGGRKWEKGLGWETESK